MKYASTLLIAKFLEVKRKASIDKTKHLIEHKRWTNPLKANGGYIIQEVIKECDEQIKKLKEVE